MLALLADERLEQHDDARNADDGADAKRKVSRLAARRVAQPAPDLVVIDHHHHADGKMTIATTTSTMRRPTTLRPCVRVRRLHAMFRARCMPGRRPALSFCLLANPASFISSCVIGLVLFQEFDEIRPGQEYVS